MPGPLTETDSLGTSTAFSEDPRCTVCLRIRLLDFLEKTLRSVLRNPFPTRRTAFVARRISPLLALRRLVDLGVESFMDGVGEFTVAVGEFTGASIGPLDPPRKSFLNLRVVLRSPFRILRDTPFRNFFILFTCVKNNHQVPYQRQTSYLVMPRPFWPLQPT